MGVDYYAVLNIPRNALKWEVKAAYRKLALQLHPCRKQRAYQQHPNPKPNGVFELPLPSIPENVYWEILNEAYDVLIDDLRREIYNMYGEEGLKRGVAAPNGFIPPYCYHKDYMRTYFEFFGSYSPYSDLIDAATKPPPLYKVSEGRGVIHKDPNIEKNIFLSLKDVLYGCTKIIPHKRKEFIDDLRNKRKSREISLSVEIRPGCLPGTKISFSNMGDETITRKPADIIFTTFDEPHEKFKRDKWNLHMNHQISLNEALTSFKMCILTFDDRQLEFYITDIVE